MIAIEKTVIVTKKWEHAMLCKATWGSIRVIWGRDIRGGNRARAFVVTPGEGTGEAG